MVKPADLARNVTAAQLTTTNQTEDSAAEAFGAAFFLPVPIKPLGVQGSSVTVQVEFAESAKRL